ncbi:MAG TPA: Uma2 family endonuclease [Thermomicrobiales bacterium]|nr:Uma2 family endonuclease [Thermomicrobiales bacterium]
MSAPSIQSRPLTYRDLESERERTTATVELIDGEIVMTPSPVPRHQVILTRLLRRLGDAVTEASRGLALPAPLDVWFDEANIMQPDIIVLLNDRLGQVTAKLIEQAPNLLVEVVSPTSRVRDRAVKRTRYARFGVPEYWLVEPGANAMVVHAEPDGTDYRAVSIETGVVQSVTIPDLAVDLAVLFAPLPGSERRAASGESEWISHSSD